MHCAGCNTHHAATARFCDACGAALVLACRSCSTVGRPGARFCSQCGVAFAAADPPMPASPPTPAPMLMVGERKHVTVLFADVRGSTAMIRQLDPEEALARIDPVVRAAAEAVSRFGGIVNEVQGDGIMALFGAPMAAEDHPVRACLAAMALLQGLPAGIEMRVGIHSGEVVLRPSGRDASDYSAVGPVVYFAKRLEQAATPGTALLSTEVAQLTRGYVDLRPLGPVQAKGWDEPVPMFELLSATARPSWEVRSGGSLSPFVGREAELGALSSALMRATLGRAQAVALVADAGMGKSRLAHEFLQTAAARGIQVVHAAAGAHTQQAPFRMAADLMRSWIGAQPEDSQATLSRRLEQAIAIGDPRDLDEAALRHLLDLALADSAAWAELTPAARRRRLLDTCRRVLLRGTMQRTRIVLVEDLHWLDEPSRALVDEVVAGSGAARLLLLATTRPEGRPDWGNWSYGLELRLTQLDGLQADKLLCSLIGPGVELASLRSRIVDRAEGTPLFLEEIARAVSEAGVVQSQPARQWLHQPSDQVEMPASIQAIVASRLDRLAPAPRSLLLTASVIGKNVRMDVLRQVAGWTEDALQSAVRALQAAEFIYEVSPGSGTEYTFKHAVTQAVAHDAVLRTERQALHARVFHAMLSTSGDRADEQLERLADHALAGGLWEQAVHYGALAAERAGARYAWRQAVAFYDGALSALAHLPETTWTLERGISLRVGLRTALGTTGGFRRGAAVLQEASALALKLGRDVSAAQFDASGCMLLSNLGELEQAVLLGRRGAAVAARAGHVPTSISLAFGLGQAHWLHGEFGEAADVLTAALPDMRGRHRTGPAGTVGNAALMGLVCLSKTHAIRGDNAAAQELATEAAAFVLEDDRPYNRSYATIAAGFAHLMAGEGQAAIDALEPGLETARRAGIDLLVASVARYLGRAYVLEGRHAAAFDLLHEAVRYSDEQSLASLSVWCGAALACAHLAVGRPEAGRLAQEAGQKAARHGYRPVQAMCLRLSASAALAKGDGGAAVATFKEACLMLDRLGMTPELALAQLALAEALRAQDQTLEAAEVAGQATQTLANLDGRKVPVPYGTETSLTEAER